MRLADAVQKFVSERVTSSVPEFTSKELHDFVGAFAKGSDSSIDRVLRNLKQQGKINYTLVSRNQSLYRALPLYNTVPSQQSNG